MSEEPANPVILDVDTGIDDALAIALAVRSPKLDLLGITTVAGNVPLEVATGNTLRVLAWLGADHVPVHPGMSGPLVRPLETATDIHGVDGIGGIELPESAAVIQAPSGPEFIVQQARANPGTITLICTAPVTNLAVALTLEPELPRLVRRVVVMGGAFTVAGNTTPVAEFNAYVDPEAAAIVARSALPLTFIGLDVTHQVGFMREAWSRLAGRRDHKGRLVYGMLGQTFSQPGNDVFYLHDPLAVAVAADPKLVETERWAVVVERDDPLTGQTLLVHNPFLTRHEVALRVNSASFLRMFAELLGLPLFQ